LSIATVTLPILLTISMLATMLVAFTAWKQRAKPSAPPIMALSLILLVWSGSYFLEIYSASIDSKLFWINFKYPAIVFLPLALATFLLRFAGWADWPKPWLGIVLLIFPLLTLLVVLTNQLHSLFWGQVVVLPETSDYTLIQISHGPWFTAHAIYSYGLLLMSAAVAIASLSRSWPVYRSEMLWLIAGISVPLLSNLISILRIHPWPGIDLTPIVAGLTLLFFLFPNSLTSILDVSLFAHTTLMEQMRDGVLVIDANKRIRECNLAAANILNLPHNSLIGKDFSKIEHPVIDLLNLHFDSGSLRIDIEINTQNGPAWYDMRVSSITAYQGQSVGYLIVWRNITDRKKIEDQLRFTSTHDQLTGLYNRMYFETEFERLKFGRERPLTIIMIDLDRLKQINDTLGHAAGDELIRQAAGIFQGVFRKEDILARIGGDEFCALLPKCDQNNATLLTSRLYQAMNKHNESHHVTFPVQFSVGTATAELGEDLAKTRLIADARLYMEKARRKQFATPDK
jgi:diguanylate cyclase (GGDEF)-like protein/PAS domain S-box-containing protein